MVWRFNRIFCSLSALYIEVTYDWLFDNFITIRSTQRNEAKEIHLKYHGLYISERKVCKWSLVLYSVIYSYIVWYSVGLWILIILKPQRYIDVRIRHRRRSKKSCNIQRKTPLLEPLFNKVAGGLFIKKRL